jgi:hypothetical protein
MAHGALDERRNFDRTRTNARSRPRTRKNYYGVEFEYEDERISKTGNPHPLVSSMHTFKL